MRLTTARGLTTTLILSTLSTSCVKNFDDESTETIESGVSQNELRFENDFDFTTSKNVVLSLEDSDNTLTVSYKDFNRTNNLVGKFRETQSKISLTLPSYVEELEVERFGNNNSSSKINIPIYGNAASLSVSTSAGGRVASTNSTCIDRLYAVENSSGGFWDIQVQDGEYVDIPLQDLQGGGSIACALDQDNGQMYYNVGKTLYRYDVTSETFHTVFTSNPFNGSYPRFEYYEGYFYMSNGSKLYKVDASTNEVVQYYKISGFVNSSSGGDLAFASDGTLYLACFSGLYRFTSFNDANESATIERISAENFPYQLTSMAIDREDDIFVGTNDGNSRLLRMKINDGSHEIVATYNHKINDLTAWRCAEEDLSQTDTDNDGIIDELDDYPNDPEAAFDAYTPSDIGMGSLAFEDNWPSKGDYDFNDLVMGYRYNVVLNSDNEALRMRIFLRIMAAGATFRSGFGMQLPFDKNDIELVSGYSEDMASIKLDEKGLEEGHSGSVIMVFADAIHELGGGSIINTDPSKPEMPEKEFEILVEFSRKLPLADFDNIPFDPFIYINQDRGRECHLKDYAPTSLADQSYFETNDDASTNGKYYVSQNNVPFAIDLIHTFRYPKEGRRIDQAYNRFVDWGTSNGESFKAWYSDAPGYRNMTDIYTK